MQSAGHHTQFLRRFRCFQGVFGAAFLWGEDTARQALDSRDESLTAWPTRSSRRNNTA